MLINVNKSALLYSRLDDAELITVQNIFSFIVTKLEFGLKYLGFFSNLADTTIKIGIGWWLRWKRESRTGVFVGCPKEVSSFSLNLY